MSSACPDPDSCDSPCNPDREKDVSCGYKGWAAPAACVPTDCPGPFASPVAVAQPVARSDLPQGKEMLPALKRSPQERSIQFFSPSADLANLNLPRFFAPTTLSCLRLPRCLFRNLSASPSRLFFRAFPLLRRPQKSLLTSGT